MLYANRPLTFFSYFFWVLHYDTNNCKIHRTEHENKRRTIDYSNPLGLAMTRKDYVAFANRIKSLDCDEETRKDFIEICLDVFKSDNSRFSAVRFIRACTPELVEA